MNGFIQYRQIIVPCGLLEAIEKWINTSESLDVQIIESKPLLLPNKSVPVNDEFNTK